MSDTQVPVIVCWGGHITELESGPKYCDGRKTVLGVHKSITLIELKDKISTRILFNLAENEIDIKCRWPLDQQTYTIVDIESNEATSLMLNLSCTPVLYMENVVANSTKSKALNEKNTNARDPLNMSGDVHFGQVNRVSAMEHIQIHSNQAAASKALRHVEMEQVATGNQLNERDINSREVDGKDIISPPNTWPSQFSSSPSDPESHDFDAERTSDKFQCGQIWALYSAIGKYPKSYGRINKIDSRNFEVHLTWLEFCPVLDLEKIWLREGMPIGCGRFRVAHETVQFDKADVFSHLVQAKQTGSKDQYDIYPRVGEVWAVYKNWHSTWQQPSDLVDCAFDIVEILEQTGSGIRVFLMEIHRSVFIPRKRRRSRSMLIPAAEYLRFSHRIPAFRLKEENYRGFWELDTASVPEKILNLLFGSKKDSLNG